MLCPVCKLDVRAGATRCPWCGSPLRSPAPVEEPPPPPPGPPPAATPPPLAPPSSAPRASLRDLGVEGPPPSLDTAPTPIPMAIPMAGPGQPLASSDAPTYMSGAGVPEPPGEAPIAPDESVLVPAPGETPPAETPPAEEPAVGEPAAEGLGVQEPLPSFQDRTFVPGLEVLSTPEAPDEAAVAEPEELPVAEAEPVSPVAPDEESAPGTEGSPVAEAEPVAPVAPDEESAPGSEGSPVAEAESVALEAPGEEAVAEPEELPVAEAEPATPEAPDEEAAIEPEELPVAQAEPVTLEAPDEVLPSEPEESQGRDGEPVTPEAPDEELAIEPEELPVAQAEPVTPDRREWEVESDLTGATQADNALADSADADDGIDGALAGRSSGHVEDSLVVDAAWDGSTGAPLFDMPAAPEAMVESDEASVASGERGPISPQPDADDAYQRFVWEDGDLEIEPESAGVDSGLVQEVPPEAASVGSVAEADWHAAAGPEEPESDVGVPDLPEPPSPEPPPVTPRSSLRDLGVEGPPPSLDTAPTPVPDLEPDDMFAALAGRSDAGASGEESSAGEAAKPESGPPSPEDASSLRGLEPIAGPPPPPARDDYAPTIGPTPFGPPSPPDDFAMTMAPQVAGTPTPPVRDDYAPTSGPVPYPLPRPPSDQVAMTMGPMMRDEPVGPPPPPEDEYAQTMGPVVMDEPPGPPPPPPTNDALAKGPPPPGPSGTPLRRGSLQALVGRQQALSSPLVRPTPPVAATPAPAPVRPRAEPDVPPSGPPPPPGSRAAVVPPMPPPWEAAPPAPATAATCPHCGARVIGAGVFCTTCGRSLAAEVVAPPATVFCSQCGYQSPPGVRYCMRCGAPMPGAGGVAVAAAPIAAGRPNNVRRRGTPWWVWVLLLMALIALGAVLWLRFGQDLIGMAVVPAGEAIRAVTRGSLAT